MPDKFREFLQSLLEEEAKEFVLWLDSTHSLAIYDDVCELIQQRFPNSKDW